MGQSMAFHASTVAAIAAGLTAAASHEAATAQVKGEVAAAAKEARLTQEAIACKEAEVKALEEALAQERAKKEAEERAHAEATAKAQADAARKDVIEAARRKVAEERARTEAELAAFEAGKARLQQAREAEAARAREEVEGRAASATAAAMEEAEVKLRRETPPGGSRVETLRSLFEGDASSRMALHPEEVDTGSSGSSGPTAYRRRKGRGKTPERSQRPSGGHPHDSDPFFTASDGDERGRRHRRGVAGGGGRDVPMEPEGESEDLPPLRRSSESSACGTETPRWGDMDEDDDMDFDYTKKPPSSDPPRRPRGDLPGPPGGGPSGHSWLGRWGVCVLVCALRLYPAAPGWGVQCGWVCLGSGFGCAPPLLAGLLRCACLCAPSTCIPPLLAGLCGVGVCACARVSAAPRHSWLR